MTTLKAHFDGHVIVPDEPVDLPMGRTLEIQVREVGELRPLGIRINKVSGLPEFDLPADAPPINLEDVRRALDDD
ncbi:MAG TPA: hypothetical protein VM008_14750 [Phycisphaerae bacterium]|nr:hypothetical protein [Phycisphaerae bacterium]